MAEDDQKCLKKLKTLREEVNWEIEKQRHKFLNQFYSLIENWEGQLPNLSNIFQSEEIDWLLKQHVKIMCEPEVILKKSLLLDFVIRCGYKDQPKVDEDASPLLRHTTPVHIVAGYKYSLSVHYITRDLFKIYERFDVNYTDEELYTHFHVACEYGCDEVVEKFLELGQDPDCVSEESDAKSVDPPMHLAVAEGHKQIVRLLLRFGADPNLTDVEGSTPLHVMCNNSHDLMKIFFKICDEERKTVQVDARDKLGRTPLHLAVRDKNEKLAELLLKRGADPNSADAEGSTPMHIMCKIGKDHNEEEEDLEDTKEFEELFFRKIVKLMLKNGADANLADAGGLTPLHILCEEKEGLKYIYNSGNMLKMFFKLNNDKHQKLHVDARDKKGNTPLHCALSSSEGKLVELLLRNGANPNLVDAKGSTPLHIISKGDKDYYYDDDRDLLKIFFEINYENHQKVQVDAVDKKGNSPLHLAVKEGDEKAIELLLRNGANPNLATAEGSTPLHIMCHYKYVDFKDIFFEFNDELHQTVQVDARDKLGQTPLHLALDLCNMKAAESLLRRGANQNLADAEGLTPLHIICKKKYPYAEKFFEINDDLNLPVRVDAQDRKGQTPLLLALKDKCKKVVELLLRRGANPNLADAEGLTPLHIMCKKRNYDYTLANEFFEINDELDHPVHVNTRNKKGQTPLHLALNSWHGKKFIELLLTRGADNLVDDDGSTPLHIICQRKYGDDLLKIFFKFNCKLHETINVVDNLGRTPLQLAVANLLTDVVDTLLDHGADVSGFVFPTDNYFAENYGPGRGVWSAVYDTMSILESLEERGFNLDQNNVLTIMKFYAEHGVITDHSVDMDECLRGDEDFVRFAKEQMITLTLSFYDFLRLPYEKAEKLFTFKDYKDISEILKHYDVSHGKYILFLCERATTRFFRQWALEFFMTLTRYQLPILCCDIIIRQLKLKDLCYISLAVANQNLDLFK